MTDRGAIEQLKGMIEFDVYSLYEVEALEHGISALQEREERSKGCAGCIYRLEVQTFEEPCLHCIRNAYELELKDNYAADS